MKLRYLDHSGFAVEDDGLTLVFDYYRNVCDGKHCPENGVVNEEYLCRPGKFYVFASHGHGDHFSDMILGWSKKRNDIVYIFSDDIKEICSRRDANISFLKKGDIYEDDILSAEAFGSTDIGVSFLVTLKADGQKIFHAGDLNNWHWREEVPPDEAKGYEDAYLSELSEIAVRHKFIDVVMFPIDPRLGKDYMLGAAQFLDKIKAGVFSPMHFWDNYDAATAFRKSAEESGAEFACWSSRGQTIKIKKRGMKMQINSRFDHFNFNVLNLDRSLEFYSKALGLKEVRRKEAEDGSFILVFLGDEKTSFSLELTWMRDRKEPYSLGECEYHLCLRVEGDYDKYREYHKEMGVVCYENTDMGLYFISDPDGYWIEILPVKN